MKTRSGIKRLISKLAAVICIALIAAACGGEVEEEIVIRDFDGNIVVPGETPSTTQATEPLPEPPSNDQPADSAESTTTTSTEPPASLAFSTDEARRTVEGLQVGAFLEETDFGSGPEPTWWIRAASGAGAAGVTIDRGLTSRATTLTDSGWAVSGGVGVFRAQVGEQVERVRLTGNRGFDEVAPDAEGFALLAARADTASDLMVEAFDQTGELLGTCTYDGTFFDCPG